MKKILALTIVLFIAGAVYAVPYEVVKEADGLNVKITMDSDTPVAGENNLNIMITDSKSQPVTDAKLKIFYSMPPVHGMPAMNYKVKAKNSGDGYTAKMNLSMSGSWDITISINRPGKPLTRVPLQLEIK